MRGVKRREIKDPKHIDVAFLYQGIAFGLGCTLILHRP
jgi:hypothetical protein